MKKLVLLFVAAAAMTMVSCSNSGQKNSQSTTGLDESVYIQDADPSVSSPVNNLPESAASQESAVADQEPAANESTTCPKCGGSGKVKCSKCHGQGSIYYAATGGMDGCRKCGGSGSAGGEENSLRRGSGKMKCPECGGSGKK